DVGEMLERGVRIPIRVRLAESARKDAAAIASLPIRNEEGVVLPLGQLARVEVAPGPSQVSRERLKRRVTVQLNVRGRDVGSFVEEARRAIDADVSLPVGYWMEWAGEYERLRSAAR